MAFNWKLVPEKFEECLETEKQKAVFSLLLTGKSWPAIAKQLGLVERSVGAMVSRIKSRIVAAGYNQDSGIEVMTPLPFVV